MRTPNVGFQVGLAVAAAPLLAHEGGYADRHTGEYHKHQSVDAATEHVGDGYSRHLPPRKKKRTTAPYSTLSFLMT